jgi:Zn finger protein HypA/HybF involved in hydrogenase expression
MKEAKIFTQKERLRAAGWPEHKDGELYCPVCDVKLEFDHHWVGMMNIGQVGNEGDDYICPECKHKFFQITLFRD